MKPPNKRMHPTAAMPHAERPRVMRSRSEEAGTTRDDKHEIVGRALLPGDGRAVANHEARPLTLPRATDQHSLPITW